MKHSPEDKNETNAPSIHERGAWAAWGLILGGMAGAVLGLTLGGPWWLLGIVIAAGAWIVGALVDRARH